jgi:hypothetical protein
MERVMVIVSTLEIGGEKVKSFLMKNYCEIYGNRWYAVLIESRMRGIHDILKIGYRLMEVYFPDEIRLATLASRI